MNKQNYFFLIFQSIITRAKEKFVYLQHYEAHYFIISYGHGPF